MSKFHEEHITAYIDGVLDASMKQEVEQRLSEHHALQAEYHAIRHVKQLLHERKDRLRPSVPADVRHSVLLKLEQEFARTTTLASIQQEDNAEHQHLRLVQTNTPTNNIYSLPKVGLRSQERASSLWNKRALLVAAVVVIALGWTVLRMGSRLNTPSETAFSSPHQHTISEVPPPTKCTFVNESLQNYNAVVQGKIKLQYATNSFDDLDAFFRKNGVTCHLVRPNIHNAKLLGGVVSEENGKKSAHLVFAHNDTLLYMWEIEETPTTIRHAAITPKGWQLLQTGEWLWDTTTAQGATVVFWEDETEKAHRTLCAVVAAMPRSELQPLFQ